MKLNRNLSLVLSLLLVTSCGPPVTTPPPASPSAAPGAAPVTPSAAPVTPGATPSTAPAAGVTTLTGQILFAPAVANASDWVVEVETIDGSFRKSVAGINNTYRISDVPTGKKVRLQAQYNSNKKVILSARLDVATSGNGLDTNFNIDLSTTAIDLIVKRAGELGKTGVTGAVLSMFTTKDELKAAVAAVQSELQTLLSPGLDNVTQTLPTSSSLIGIVDGQMTAVETAITGTSTPIATPVPTASATPAPASTPAPSTAPAVFSPVSIVIQPSANAKIAKDTVVRFFVEAKDANGQIQIVNPIWTSSSNSVAGIMDSSGKFTPQAKGNVTYKATYNNLTADVTIEVTDGEISEINIIPDQSSITLDAGTRFQLKAEGSDSLGNRNLLVTPTWSLEDASIGTVDINGIFVGLREGKTDVTAEVKNKDDDEFKKTFELDVEPGAPSNVDVEPASPSVLVGKTQLFKLYASDIASNVSTSAFSFSVEDGSIGSIDGSGNFRALKAGTTNIKISSSNSVGVVKTIPITVAADSPYISTLSKIIVTPGETITITGENFSNVAAENKVTFDGVAANVIAASATTLTVVVPAGTISGFAEVTTNGKKGNGFFYIIEPIITDVTPSNADVGDIVTLTGSHFDVAHPIRNIVTFGTTQASAPVSVTSTTLQVPLPSGGAGENDVRVLVRGQSSNFKSFQGSGSNTDDDIDWVKKEKMPTQRAFHTFRRIGDDIYALGGDNSSTSRRLEEYDVSEDDWTSRQDLPTSRTRFAVAVADSDLFAVGGDGGNKVCERYDPDNNSWSAKASMLVGRSRLVLEEVNGKLYAIGGIGDSNAGVTVEEYTPSTNVWVTKANAPSTTFDAASAVLNGKIYIIGGSSSGTKDVMSYNPDTNTWDTNIQDLPSARKNGTAITLNGKIYFIGGFDSSNNEVGTVYEFDPSTDSDGSWKSIDALPEVRAAAAVAERSGKLYVSGGLNGSGSLQDVLYRGTFK